MSKVSLQALALALGAFSLFSIVAEAGGKKPPTPPGGGHASLTTPVPVRLVLLRPVSTKIFQLPNGSRIDLAADFDSLFNTAVTEAGAFAPTDSTGSGNRPCDHHIEIRATVSTMEFNIAQFGLKFGYIPAGELSTISNATGSLDVKVGQLAMDFSVWECVEGRCATVAANTQASSTLDLNLQFAVDFSVIHTGASFLYRTPLGAAFRKIMKKGMETLSVSPRLHELSWSAQVREVNPQNGEILFDQGSQSRIAPEEAFTVYAGAPADSACKVFKPVAYVRTSSVDTVSSFAQVDEILDPRGIQVGDTVMVRHLKK
jgi:hypothetical protein